jgi:hypothetical protein
MDLAAAEWKWASLHEKEPFHDGSFEDWVKERSDSHPFHYSDGVRIWVADVDYEPEGTWLGGGLVDGE